MLYNIEVHIDEADKEILETKDSKLAMEQTIYRLIHQLKQAHNERASRNQPLSRGFNGFQK
jgi:translation initiation factor IF-2